jgi:hypothetical protein
MDTIKYPMNTGGSRKKVNNSSIMVNAELALEKLRAT